MPENFILAAHCKPTGKVHGKHAVPYWQYTRFSLSLLLYIYIYSVCIYLHIHIHVVSKSCKSRQVHANTITYYIIFVGNPSLHLQVARPLLPNAALTDFKTKIFPWRLATNSPNGFVSKQVTPNFHGLSSSLTYNLTMAIKKSGLPHVEKPTHRSAQVDSAPSIYPLVN